MPLPKQVQVDHSVFTPLLTLASPTPKPLSDFTPMLTKHVLPARRRVCTQEEKFQAATDWHDEVVRSSKGKLDKLDIDSQLSPCDADREPLEAQFALGVTGNNTPITGPAGPAETSVEVKVEPGDKDDVMEPSDDDDPMEPVLEPLREIVKLADTLRHMCSKCAPWGDFLLLPSYERALIMPT
ncbi:uncharacterized protein MELLADRAFT_109588 [Melampsora larici-populina 98AG31]|uniref:Uncharacterized protein n=1 Tax=Melampsora larici-populina (strain 98AG31 / pathotype 3-4-7) TaxID=747676 RepID=F4RWZ2_MELLP|nr:uncharacterized protein MELLADRAFT_109588 [Melampsora larici-populina 98AG31]EGG03106.1 hypothetical protein MELLADRAFT_109588 [Melampsora larici-populina 98AG31]